MNSAWGHVFRAVGPMSWLYSEGADQYCEMCCRQPSEHRSWWNVVHKGTKAAVRTADGHYSRQKPGTSQFTRPGKNLVLLGQDERSVWVSWRPAVGGRMDGLECYECVMYSRKSGPVASEQIIEAMALTEELWGPPPKDGWITFIKPTAIKSVNPGYCFKRAGFKPFGTNAAGNLIRLQR